MAETGSSDKLKVFISYSRRDSTQCAEELVEGLKLAGFDPLLDRRDIVAGEDWEARLGGLIKRADTVVFVISPEAVKSERCAWEVDRALAEARRVIPVIFKPVSEADIPRELQRRQYLRIDLGPGITRQIGQLAEALRQDIDWIREHSRLAEQADRWKARGRPESMLLHGDDIAAAQSWADKRKPDAPEITQLMQAFIAASKQAKSTRLRRNRMVTVLIGLLVVALAVGAAAWWNQDRLKEEIYIWTNVTVLEL